MNDSSKVSKYVGLDQFIVEIYLVPQFYEPLHVAKPTAQELSNELDGRAYLDAAVLPAASSNDALHVAAATVARADLILSWNFKHIVNFRRIRLFNSVNLAQGYGIIDIRSPAEIAYGNQTGP